MLEQIDEIDLAYQSMAKAQDRIFEWGTNYNRRDQYWIDEMHKRVADYAQRYGRFESLSYTYCEQYFPNLLKSIRATLLLHIHRHFNFWTEPKLSIAPPYADPREINVPRIQEPTVMGLGDIEDRYTIASLEPVDFQVDKVEFIEFGLSERFSFLGVNYSLMRRVWFYRFGYHPDHGLWQGKPKKNHAIEEWYMGGKYG